MHAATRPLAGSTLLLVHADPLARHDLAMALARAGARVRSSATGADAVRIAALEPLDALIWDVDGARDDVFAALAEIRGLSAGRGRNVPVLAVGPALADWGAPAGAFEGHVPSPIAPDQLVVRVCGLLGRCGARSGATTRRLPRVG